MTEMSRGKQLAVITAVYMCIKPVLNWLLLGGSLMPLALGFAALICFWLGLKYSNLVIAILLMLVACANMPTNVKQMLSQPNPYLFYAIEGVLDMLFACLLAFHPEVRRHCGCK